MSRGFSLNHRIYLCSGCSTVLYLVCHFTFLELCVPITVANPVAQKETDIHIKGCPINNPISCPPFGACCSLFEFCHAGLCESCFFDNLLVDLEWCRTKGQYNVSLMRSEACEFACEAKFTKKLLRNSKDDSDNGKSTPATQRAEKSSSQNLQIDTDIMSHHHSLDVSVLIILVLLIIIILPCKIYKYYKFFNTKYKSLKKSNKGNSSIVRGALDRNGKGNPKSAVPQNELNDPEENAGGLHNEELGAEKREGKKGQSTEALEKIPPGKGEAHPRPAPEVTENVSDAEDDPKTSGDKTKEPLIKPIAVRGALDLNGKGNPKSAVPQNELNEPEETAAGLHNEELGPGKKGKKGKSTIVLETTAGVYQNAN